MFEQRIEVLKRHKGGRTIFLETGTLRGDGVQAALTAGYTTVWSCEFNREMAERSAKRFAGDGRVRIFHQDSAAWLQEITPNTELVTIWLDAHAPSKKLSGPDPCPLLAELAAIANWPGPEPVIMVDDFDAMGTDVFHQRAGTTGCAPAPDEVREAIVRLGRYEFHIEDTERPGKLLVAVPV